MYGPYVYMVHGLLGYSIHGGRGFKKEVSLKKERDPDVQGSLIVYERRVARAS